MLILTISTADRLTQPADFNRAFWPPLSDIKRF